MKSLKILKVWNIFLSLKVKSSRIVLFTQTVIAVIIYILDINNFQHFRIDHSKKILKKKNHINGYIMA